MAACQRFVEDLLAYARAPTVQRADVDMGELLRETVRRFEAGHPGWSGRIDLAADEATVSVDPVRIRQLLQNVLRNAADASPGDARIAIEGEAVGEGYRLTVADRGPGISAQERETVFQAFNSGHGGGTGLGLAVCKAIAEAHGGTIEALPRDGGGTRMVVHLPSSVRPGTVTDGVTHHSSEDTP